MVSPAKTRCRHRLSFDAPKPIARVQCIRIIRLRVWVSCPSPALAPHRSGVMGVAITEDPAVQDIPEGFCKQARGGLNAMRVPFDNFAGYVENSSGAKIAPLHLILEVPYTSLPLPGNTCTHPISYNVRR